MQTTFRAPYQRRSACSPRCRLPRRPVDAVAAGGADVYAPPGPVLPPRHEGPPLAPVVGRVPQFVEGHPVQVVVVDDGSTDATAVRARAAGAEVVALQPARGLGAAVRHGLRHAVDVHGAAAVAFCDADGEYAPEELAD